MRRFLLSAALVMGAVRAEALDGGGFDGGPVIDGGASDGGSSDGGSLDGSASDAGGDAGADAGGCTNFCDGVCCPLPCTCRPDASGPEPTDEAGVPSSGGCSCQSAPVDLGIASPLLLFALAAGVRTLTRRKR